MLSTFGFSRVLHHDGTGDDVSGGLLLYFVVPVQLFGQVF